MKFLFSLPIIGKRVWSSDLHYSKPCRITIGKAGIQITTKTKAYGLSFSPILF